MSTNDNKIFLFPLGSGLRELPAKRLPCFLWVVLALALTSSASASNTLLGLWRFNETNGTTVVDSSGLGHDGTLQGDNSTLPTRVAGQTGFGGALMFTNNGTDHSYVDIPASPVLMIGVATNDAWTFAVWANESSGGTGDFVATYGRIFTQDAGLGLEWESGASGDDEFYVWHNSLAAWKIGLGTSAAVVPVLDQWVHWALVYDGTNLTMYRNANQGSLGAVTSVPLSASLAFDGYAGGIQIGSQLNETADRNWNGLMDDFAVFSGALSQSEIQTIMTGDFSAYVAGTMPTIVSQPQDQVVNLGLSATFNVTATGSGSLSYQWQFNGANLAGATTTILTITNVQAGNAGSYSVIVRNANASTNSRSALLTVLTPLPPTLVGLWRFDEGTGDQALDSSGLTNNGTLTTDAGSLPSWVPSQTGFGQALQFPNDGANHSYVDVAASDSLKIGLTANDTWTITLWAKELSDGAGNYVATYGRFFAQDGGLGMNLESGAPGDSQFYVWHNSLSAWQKGFGVNAAVVPLLDQWVHLALVYDGQNLTLYRNANQGTLGAKTSLSQNASLDYTSFGGYQGSFQIGSQLNERPSRNFNGLLDDVAVFTGALNETQLKTVMDGNFTTFLNKNPQLSINRSGSQLVISWGFGVLESSAQVMGGWQDVTGASPLVIGASQAASFYRVRR